MYSLSGNVIFKKAVYLLATCFHSSLAFLAPNKKEYLQEETEGTEADRSR